jgi:hypothetical protein
MHEIYTKICSVLFVCRTQAKKRKKERFFRMRKTKNIKYMYSRQTTKKKRKKKQKR